MKKSLVPLSLTTLLALLTAAYAVERALAARVSRNARDQALGRLEESKALLRKHPTAFSASAPPAGTEALKSLAQEAAAKRALKIGSLSESEREGEAGRRERQVIIRFVRAPHAGIVRYLGDLEARGAGARVKELHLRPSPDQTGVYDEAEIVLSKTVAVTEGKP